MLYLVSTPIGNLEDITFRALNTLFSVDYILCEDTRKTQSLLNHFLKQGLIVPKLVSYFEENESTRNPQIITDLKSEKNIALVSNAGTPTISDPGFKLIRECVKENIKIVPVPGPSAITSALSASGLPTDKFLFIGFPSNKQNQREKLFVETKKSLEGLSSTVIFYEAPFRLIESLESLNSVFGDIEIIIAREMTKVYEEFKKGKISEIIKYFSQKEIKGEFVVLFNLKQG
jgi:16S rRNA (cytidine1402-2'-O)-methyltransferase